MHPALTLYNRNAPAYINSDFTLDTLDSACLFSEGPVWNEAGYYLFSDIPANAVYKLIPGGAKEIYLQPSGLTRAVAEALSNQPGSNGLAYNNEGDLLLCQHGNGAVALLKNGRLQPLITTVNGKPFNSPNDIVVHRDGTVFFSDPPYGLKDAQLAPGARQEGSAFYAWRNGELTAFCTDYQYPNGLCLSPDGERLYVGSSKPFEKFITAFDTCTLQRIGVVAEETTDGLKCDRAGNIYLCTKEGIVVIDPAGNRMARIALDTVPANCCWGGADGGDLFVTARQNIFLLRNLQKGGV